MSEPPPDAASRAIEGAAVDVGRGSFGAWLRHQREARGVSLREIANASKISLRYLEALEQDRFDVLPAPVFARGFLREYARVVGLNPDDVVNLFLVAIEERKEVAARVEPGRALRARRAPSSLGYGLLLALAVIAFLAVAAFLSFYAERRADRSPPSNLIAPVPVAREPIAAVHDSAPPAVTLARSRVTTGGESGIPVEQAIGGTFKVVLSFSQDCWVESVVDGRRRTSELRAGGETVTLEAEEVVVLTFGNVAAVSIEVNDRPFPFPAGAGHVVRELSIDRAAAGLANAVPTTRQP